jgi:hypothetical protein
MTRSSTREAGKPGPISPDAQSAVPKVAQLRAACATAIDAYRQSENAQQQLELRILIARLQDAICAARQRSFALRNVGDAWVDDWRP